jgi:hypothetical protein
MLSIRWTRPGPGGTLVAVPPAPAAGPGAGRPPAGRGTGTPRPGAVEAAQDAADAATTAPATTAPATTAPATVAPAAAPAPTATPPPHSSRKRTHRAARRRRSVLVRFDEAEYAAIAAAGNRADLSPTAYVGVAALAGATGTEPPGSPVREALVELNQARTAAVRIGVAVNKLAAKALAGGAVTAAELAAAAEAASRSVARVEVAAALVHRRLA